MVNADELIREIQGKGTARSVQEIEHEGRLKNLCYDCFLDRDDD